MYRPKNCTNCGKNKYQQGGNNLLPLLNPQMINEAMIDRPLPDAETPSVQMSPFQELISKGVIEAPQGWEGTAQQYYDHVNTPQKKDKIKDLQRLGIGLQGARTGLSWLAGAVERNRQNQFDMTQQTALGMMNPMQVDDFQPNPYNLYMMKGGKLTNIVKDYNKWSNDAGPMDMTHGEGNKYLQQGGKLSAAAKNYYDMINSQGKPQPSYNFGNAPIFSQHAPNWMDSADYRIFFNDARKLYNTPPTSNLQGAKNDLEWKLNEALPYIFVNSDNVKNAKTPADLKNDIQASVIIEENAYKDWLNQNSKVNLSPYLSRPPQSKRPMKKGGYEIDRMLVVRKLLPELLNLGRLGTRKYRGHGMKKGGTLTPNKAREILHDGTAHGKPLTDKQRKFFGAKSKGHTNYRGK